jgi:Tfp pilus assembly protein PilV
MRRNNQPENSAAGYSSHPGFTLVEFLVSFTLVTLLITGTAQLTIHTLFVKRNADLNMKTAELASSFLEYIKSLPYESDELNEGSREKSIKEEGFLEIFIRQWNVTDIAPNLKRIEVKCFSENRRFKKTRLVLYLSKELGF